MKIWEEILEDMRKGVKWSVICEKYRSKSQLYEALRNFCKESALKYECSGRFNSGTEFVEGCED